MIRKTASPKSTGGGGEVFETQVCALYLSHLLFGSIPFSFRPGNISRVDFQVKVDGWLFDDFLVTTEDEGGRVACTIKSSQIFGQETVPKAVIRDAWVQYLHGDSSVFERNKDFLLICTVTLPPKIRPRLHQLINMASKMVPEQLDDRLSKPNGYVSKELVSLYAQFRCPSEMINGTGVAEPLPGELLSRLRVREYDFQESDSRDLRDGLYFCGQILKDKSVEASRRLWDRLVSIVSERKPIGGGISRKELQDELIGEFELCDYPNFNADWELLREDCAFALELIQDTIGGSYRIPRDDEIHSFDVSFVKNDVLILSGPSGSGKSALVKRWLKAKKKSVEVVWASAPTLERLVPRKWGENISLMNPLQDILSNFPAGERYAVLDALEQVISENQIENLRFLLSLLGKSSGPRWKIFITCQPEALNRIMHILVGRPGFSSEQEIKSLETIRDDQLNDLLSNFPSFRRLSFRPEFRPVLRNLKLLDLMARGFEIGEFDPSQWIGESDFMNWYWRTVITRANTKTAQSQFLQSLAARQADRSIAHISLSELDPNDHSHVEELRLDGVLVIKEERIWFAHDIQADWARTRLLISKGENFIEFVTPKLHFPMWFKAIRLYALTLIEKGDDFASFSAIWQASQGQNLQSLRDLFIEGALFAGNPENALRRLEPLLFQNNGLLLRRLLKRFEFLLSVPDPKYRLLLPEDEQLDLDIYLSSSQRIPLVAQWLPILRWIIQHRDQCSKYAPTEVASIGFTWLSKMPVHLPNQNSFPCRKDLGEIVLGLAENLNTETWKGSWYHCDGKSSEIIYRSALYAAYEHPERVQDFALVACCRKPPPGWAEVKQNQANVPEKIDRVTMPALATFDFDDETPPEPWPDGPIKRVDEAFRKVCLDSTALQPLMHTQPDLCIEILLTVLIEEPTPRRRRGYDDSSFELERLNFESTYDFYPPLWFRGPFLSFFQINPSCAIKFLCKLVDFATDRTFDYRLEDGEQPFSISIPFNDGVKEYLGGPNIFLWFRDQSHVPDVVVSALMAFEKWLYLMIDLKEDVSVYLKEALTQTKSVAIVGVALEVGKKSPELFTGVLRPFLASEYFYDWDTQRLASLEGFQMMGWGLESEQFAKLAKGFHGLPHRKYELSGIAIQFFLNDESMVSCFNEAREEWQRKLKKNPDNLSLENLCLWFDGKNWHEVETPNGEKALEFRAPKSVEEKRKEGLEESQKRLLISTTPLKLHKLIEERRELSDSEAEQLWHSVTYFENILTDADAEGLKSK